MVLVFGIDKDLLVPKCARHCANWNENNVYDIELPGFVHLPDKHLTTSHGSKRVGYKAERRNNGTHLASNEENKDNS